MEYLIYQDEELIDVIPLTDEEFNNFKLKNPKLKLVPSNEILDFDDELFDDEW